jgi:hypothetical protein
MDSHDEEQSLPGLVGFADDGTHELGAAVVLLDFELEDGNLLLCQHVWIRDSVRRIRTNKPTALF